MKNKVVGYIIIGFALIIGFIIFLFNRALSEIVSTSCDHGMSCPMWGSISFHTNISIGVMVLIILIGIYMIFFADKVSRKEYDEENKSFSEKGNLDDIKNRYEEMKSDLDENEVKIMDNLFESNGTMFQSDIVDKTDLNKVKVTRILDKLEGKNLIERRRRGMTNVVILKH